VARGDKITSGLIEKYRYTVALFSHRPRTTSAIQGLLVAYRAIWLVAWELDTDECLHLNPYKNSFRYLLR
jgi:hypothetical protein